MADPKDPRHYEESFKRQIVRLYENGEPAREIKDEYDISHSTLHRWVQGIRNSGSTKAADNRTPEQNVFCFNVCSTGSAVFFRSVG